MTYISRSIFSLLLCMSFSAFAQDPTELQVTPQNQTQQPADTVTPVRIERYGIRVGIDLHSLSRSFYNTDHKGLELVADYRLSKKYYAAAEIGNVDYTKDEAQLNFTTKGSYIKAGIDINAYDNWLDMENMVYIGFRYGLATFSQNLNSYKIYQNSDALDTADDQANYFDDVTVNANQKYSSLTAQWAEVVAGLKAEIFDNLYIGASIRLNYLISDKKPDTFDNLYIPGFNRTYDGSFGVGFNYTLSYFIPFYKKQNTPAFKEAKKKG